MTADTKRARVLVVEDEQKIADRYAGWLADEYDVQTANSGKKAQESLTDREADIVVLDRQMSFLSGDGVPRWLDETGCGTQVIMITAVSPSAEVATVPIDDYITKPVEKKQLRYTVETAALVRTYDEHITQLLTLTARRQALEQELPADQMETSEEFGQLVTRIEYRWESIDDTMDELWTQLATDLFARIERTVASSQIANSGNETLS